MKQVYLYPLVVLFCLSSTLARADWPPEVVVEDEKATDLEVPEGTVSLPAEASAKTNADGSAGGQAGVGFKYDFTGGYLRARINIAAAPFEIRNGKPGDYAAFLLQPDLKGATVAVDAAKIWRPGAWHLAAAGGIRVSPKMVWAVETTTTDAAGATRTTTDARDAIAASLVAGFVAGLDLPGPTPELQAHITFEVPLTLRVLMGPSSQDGDFLLKTLGDKNTVFLGIEPRVRVGVGDLAVFASLPMLATFNAGNVPGLTGINFIVGAEVRGDVVSWTVGGSTKSRQRRAEEPASARRSRSAAQLSL